MHVVHLEAGRHLYGGARQVLYLLDGLVQRQVQVTLVCPDDSAIGRIAPERGIPTTMMPIAGDLDLRFWTRFSRYLRDQRPDLLHVHSRRGADFWGGVAARRARVPAVLSRRVDKADPRFLGRIKYGQYRSIVAISADIRRRLMQAGVPKDKVALVHSAVEPFPPQPACPASEFRRRFGLGDRARPVGVVAQLIPRKGHRYLIAAWPQVVARERQARLLIFGTGDEEGRLRRQARAEGVADSVIFAGFRDDLRDYLGHLELLVHPALREGLGICLLEAQAAGVPVVASRVGGIPEAVEDEVSGILISPGDADAIARSVNEIMEHRNRAEHMGQAGRRHVERHFSVAEMVSGNLNVYNSVLERQRHD